MRHVRRLVGLIVAALVLTPVLAGCAAGPTDRLDASTATVIDVRTPAEYAEGHLDGAVNIDLQSGSFAAEVSALPADASYIVYCRSGNRSAQAVEVMRQAGFTQVVDAGGIAAAAERTGLTVVVG